MDIKNILSKVDHTLLSQTATLTEIEKLCQEGIANGVASVCIPPCYIKSAKEYIKDKLTICTVVGFPNGYSTQKTKLCETEEALQNGAGEIDMVINLAHLKNKEYEKIENEIYSLKKVCGENILKVIIESCFLTEEEKITMCKIITSTGADFIKTSTGFASSGATIEDITLFKKNIGNGVKIKAAGGISGLETAQKFIDAGASRLGSSKIVKLAQML